MNFYEQPAQAQFVNTYVPLPFEQLMSVANMYKQEYDKSNAQLAQFNKESSNFNSLSQKDIATWDRETSGRIKPLLDKIGSNSEFLKTAEGRAEISKTINSTNYGLLNKLRSNASVLSEAAKSYDPRWGDDTMQQITNWDTEKDNMFTGRNIKYQTLGELSNPYFDLLGKGKYMGKDKSGLFDQYGLDMSHLESVASSDTINELYNTPEGQKHIALAKQRGELTEGQDERKWLHDAIIQSQIGRMGVVDMKMDPFAMENARMRTKLGVKKAGKNGDENEDDTSTYAMMRKDLGANYGTLLATNPAFAKVREGVEYANSVKEEIADEADAYRQAAKEGKITEKQLSKNLENLSKQYEERVNGIGDPRKNVGDGFKSIFSQFAGFDTTSSRDYKNESFNARVYNAADAVVNSAATPTAYIDLAEYNKVVSNGEVVVNDGDVPMNGYAVKGGKGFKLITETANNLMGLEGGKRFKPNYEIKSVHGGKLNIAADLNAGNINGAVKIPTGQIIATDVNGSSQIAQLVDLLVPESSLIQRGYDPEDAEEVIKQSMGISPVTNIGTKALTKDNAADNYGSGDGRVSAPFSGRWYRFKVTEVMPKNDISRVEAQTQVDLRLGTTYSGDAREERVGQSYAPEYYNEE